MASIGWSRRQNCARYGLRGGAPESRSHSGEGRSLRSRSADVVKVHLGDTGVPFDWEYCDGAGKSRAVGRPLGNCQLDTDREVGMEIMARRRL
jgi:hypothetical protein